MRPGGRGDEMPGEHAQLAHELLVAQQRISALVTDRGAAAELSSLLRRAVATGRHDPAAGRRQVAAVMARIGLIERRPEG